MLFIMSSHYYLIWLDCFLSLSKLEDNTVLVPYSIGRKDCDSSQGMPKRNLPGHTLLDGVSYLKDAFDLNTKEAVALLGKYMCMHSLSCVYMLYFYMEPLKLLFTFWERLRNYDCFAFWLHWLHPQCHLNGPCLYLGGKNLTNLLVFSWVG